MAARMVLAIMVALLAATICAFATFLMAVSVCCSGHGGTDYGSWEEGLALSVT